MIGERYSTSRPVTRNLPDNDAPSRRSVICEKIKCEVEEPMSMPTLLSENISNPSMSVTISSSPMMKLSG